VINLEDLIPENMKAIEVPKFVQENKPWSMYQSAFFNHVEKTSENLVLEAVAGSGKTTTILEAMRRLKTSNVLFLAFNKSIQMELASRVPPGVTTKTLNALGHGIISPHLTNRKINSYKPQNILRAMLKDDVYKEYGWELAKVLSSARTHGIGVRTSLDFDTWYDFLMNSPMFIPDGMDEKFAEILRLAFDKMLAEWKENFDFDDQLYIPIFMNYTFPKFDVVFIDEAQDLSYINHMQLQKLSERGARIIAVGDSRQAIYGFRGADQRSMSNLADKFSATTLPLSICYRCGKSIVRHAQSIVPYIEFADTQIEGTIITHDEYPPSASYEHKSMIICRNNAPLFSLALQFLRERVPCYMVMDIGKDLEKLIDRMGASSAAQLKDRLIKWRDDEIEKLKAKHRDHLIPMVEDKVDCLLPFCEEYQFVLQIKSALQQLTASTFGPRLSSVHKAKGLEADHVYILRPDLMPSQQAIRAQLDGNDAPMMQEENLRYVAITRAKAFLHYLPRQ